MKTIHHKNGDPHDNTISNLEIRTMPTILERIRRAFAKPVSVTPRVSGCDYEEDRYRVNCLRSMGRRVQIGPHSFTVCAEDFGSILDCEKAASRLVEILRTEGAAFKDRPIIELLDDLADRVREERDKRGISQERLGQLAKVHRTYIGMIERAEKNITLTNMEKIARALGFKLKNLIDF